ncbi:MAG: response regulator transcription factor [Oscillospiraceae bacterium]|nr:response regulator transcription factor [Oscillospiraceae bacterium]
MRIAICDDELPMHDLLKRHLDSYARKRNLSVMYSDYTGGKELLAFPQDLDLIFMDYQMKELDGLETARKLRAARIDTPIIFLTGFPHIVFDTFEVNAYRFLVKPVDPEKLAAAMDGLLSDQSTDQYIVIKDGDLSRRINIDDIIYAEASDKYCFVRTTEEGFVYKKTLAEFESLLPEDRFFRSHRTYLVGFRHVVSHTETMIVLDNQEKALISKLKRTPFKKAFQDYIKRYHFANRC